MAIKKVVTADNIGKGLAVEGGKLNVNIDDVSMVFDNATGKLKAKMPTATDFQGDELQDLNGTSLGHLVRKTNGNV